MKQKTNILPRLVYSAGNNRRPFRVSLSEMYQQQPEYPPGSASPNSHGLVITVAPIPPLVAPGTPRILPDGDLDPLFRERLAQVCAVNHAGKLLGREDLELIAETGGEDRGGAGVELARLQGRTIASLQIGACSWGDGRGTVGALT